MQIDIGPRSARLVAGFEECDAGIDVRQVRELVPEISASIAPRDFGGEGADVSDRDRGARPSCLARESPSAGKISVFLEFSKVCETVNFRLSCPSGDAISATRRIRG
jgi:hypothetical protein